MSENKQLLDEIFVVICRIINVEVRVINRAEGEGESLKSNFTNNRSLQSRHLWTLLTQYISSNLLKT